MDKNMLNQLLSLIAGKKQGKEGALLGVLLSMINMSRRIQDFEQPNWQQMPEMPGPNKPNIQDWWKWEQKTPGAFSNK